MESKSSISIDESDCNARHHSSVTGRVASFLSSAVELTCHASEHCAVRRMSSNTNTVAHALERLKHLRAGGMPARLRNGNSAGPAPLLLYAPVPEGSAVVEPAAAGEREAYVAKYGRDYFLSDVLHLRETFFPPSYRGFFVEAGGLDGRSSLSNTWHFERHLGWRGLLVVRGAKKSSDVAQPHDPECGRADCFRNGGGRGHGGL